MTRHELEDERTFLLRSLEDLDREHDAGDLSDEDHAVLRDGYIARTAEVLRSLDGAPSPVAPAGSEATGFRRRHASSVPPVVGVPRVRRRGRRLALAAGVVVVVGCVVWAVADHVGARLPGETVTGSVTLTPTQQTARTLAQAETLESEGNAVGALKLYESVLRRHPSQEEALAEAGWLEYEAGALGRSATLLALGEGREQQAVRVDPGAFAPHLYLGSMLLAQGDPAGAVSEYETFLADHPPSATVRSAATFITKAFTDAHEVPPALPVGGSTPAG
jgi:tetratricopeptide (TPR) repeat protein